MQGLQWKEGNQLGEFCTVPTSDTGVFKEEFLLMEKKKKKKKFLLFKKSQKAQSQMIITITVNIV